MRLPRFKFTADFMLADTLKRMGMRRTFTGNADFSGITTAQPLQISEVIHKAFVSVDEYGTEAAAATAVVAPGASIETAPPLDFRADHPFLMVLRDKVTGSILFMGRVVQPSAS